MIATIYPPFTTNIYNDLLHYTTNYIVKHKFIIHETTLYCKDSDFKIVCEIGARALSGLHISSFPSQ